MDMEDGKLDEILSILQDIQQDMGGMAAKKLMPKEETPMMEAVEDPAEEAAESPMEEKSEMEDVDNVDTSLPRWKQRLAQYGKKKIGM